MIIPDLNLLLYAHDATSPHHRAAIAWWEGCINGAEPVGLPHVVIFGFLRLATSGRVFVSPMSIEEAVGCVRTWLERPHVVEAEGGTEHVSSVVDLLLQSGSAGNLSTDAQIAAVALHHGATLFTNDSDFRRFPGVRTRNPLAR